MTDPTDPQAELREQVEDMAMKYNIPLADLESLIDELLTTERERATEKIILNLYQNNLVEKDKHSSDFDMVHVHVPRLRFIITEALKKGTDAK